MMLAINKNLKQNKSAKLASFAVVFLLSTSSQTPLQAIEKDYDPIFIQEEGVAAPKIKERNIPDVLEERFFTKQQSQSLYQIQSDKQLEEKQGFLKELKAEKKHQKLMQRGKMIRKVGDFAGKTEQYLDTATPIIIGVNILFPPAAPYIDPLFTGAKCLLKGAHMVLPIIGEKVMLHHATKLSEKSFIRGNISEEKRNELIILKAQYQIKKLGTQLHALISENKRSSYKKKNQKLINEKTMKLMSYYNIIQQYQ